MYHLIYTIYVYVLLFYFIFSILKQKYLFLYFKIYFDQYIKYKVYSYIFWFDILLVNRF